MLLTALGGEAMFAPVGMLDPLGVESKGRLGLNSVGGLMVGTAAVITVGLLTADTIWFLAAAVFMAVAGFGRLLGIPVDGFDKEVVRPTVVEFVLFACSSVPISFWEPLPKAFA